MTGSSTPSTRRRRWSFPGDRASAAGLVAGATTAVTLTVSFGLLALDFEYFWMTYVLGFGVVMPMALGAVGLRRPKSDEQDGRAATDQQTPLEQLQMRYARGELSDAEFEQRVGHLLESDPGERTQAATTPERNRQ
jgi:uncharacterized membrane protein